ncbi:MAG: DUF3102 domain-containing protein [Deltaproteobacteria bacterium]|nr:DUF3102 domain-containing protein [Deltaproteobacteria bacterium]
MAEEEKARLAEIISLHGEMVGHDTEINDLTTLRLQKSIRSGELLIEQKKFLKSRKLKWGPWIKENLPYSQTTATRYMKLYRNRKKICNLQIFGKSEAYVALTDPRKRPEDDFETEDEWDEMWRELLNKTNEAKQKREADDEKKEEEGGENDQESNGQEGGEPGDSTNQTRQEEDDLPYGNLEEEIDFKKTRLLKLAERGQWGNCTLNQTLEAMNLSRDPEVQARVVGATEFLLMMEEMETVRIAGAIEKVKNAFKHLMEVN